MLAQNLEAIRSNGGQICQSTPSLHPITYLWISYHIPTSYLQNMYCVLCTSTPFMHKQHHRRIPFIHHDTSSVGPATNPRKLIDWPVVNRGRNSVGATDFPKSGAITAITRTEMYGVCTCTPYDRSNPWPPPPEGCRMNDIHTLYKLDLELSVCFFSFLYQIEQVSVHYGVLLPHT